MSHALGPLKGGSDFSGVKWWVGFQDPRFQPSVSPEMPGQDVLKEAQWEGADKRRWHWLNDHTVQGWVWPYGWSLRSRGEGRQYTNREGQHVLLSVINAVKKNEAREGKIGRWREGCPPAVSGAASLKIIICAETWMNGWVNHAQGLEEAWKASGKKELKLKDPEREEVWLIWAPAQLAV